MRDLTLLAVFLGISTNAGAASYVTNQSAAVAAGQQNLSLSGINATAGVAASGLFLSSGAWAGSDGSGGTMLIVADAANNRVLVYNPIPAASGVPADLVIGQPDSSSNFANQGGSPAANTLSGPSGVYFDGAALYIADQGNNRVLIFNTFPTASNASADVVVGQLDFVSNLPNRGGAPAANTLSRPSAVWSDGVNNLYVADEGNNRVLLYNPIPSAPDASAGVVVGQAAMNSGARNQGGPVGAYTLSSPTGLWSDGTRLFISDQLNNRVLIYNSVPAVSNSSADVVVGQLLLTTGTANQGGAVRANTLSAPSGVYSDGVKLVVSDQLNNRVLIYNAIPAVNNSSASVVVGQGVMTSSAANQGAGATPAANTLRRPSGVVSDGAALYVVDQSNNRLLIYSSIPAANNTSAGVVVGQSDMVTGTPNQASAAPGAGTLFRPGGTSYDGKRLFIADRFNSRVLIFNTIPPASNPSADAAVGQSVMTSSVANQGGIGAATLSFPADVQSDGTRLFVADQFNSRVLIYNAIPSANGVPANVVLGQAAMNAGAPNRSGPVSAFTLSFPVGVFSNGTQLFVSDRSNSRVLIYKPVPSVSNSSAAVVVGQIFMSSGTSNRGGPVGPGTLSFPGGIHSDGARLFVADQFNNRVLIYNSIPTVNGSTADVVIGQATMNAGAPNRGLPSPAANTLSRPADVYSDGTSLYIADQGNNRILIYNTIPTVSNASADIVIGQAGMTSAKPNQGASVSADTLSGPVNVAADSTTGRMFVSDVNSNRVLIYLSAAVSTVTTSGGSVTVNSPLGPVQIQAQVPPGAFIQPVSMTLSVLTGFPSAPSLAAVLKPTGVGLQIDISPLLQPVQDVTLIVTYRPSDMAGFDVSKLVVARYDPTGGVWVPFATFSDTANNRVIAQVNHFSMFQLMQTDTSGNSVSTVNIFPNPLQPARGQRSMTFSSAPPNTRIRIYTVSGVLIKDISTDSSGLARWDATNQAGAGVASGVYFAFVQAGGKSAAMKLAVQR